MAAPRNVTAARDEESGLEPKDDSPSSNLRTLKDQFSMYAENHPAQFILGYCFTYIFMQTFMIPGTIFMPLLARALFGVVRGIMLIVFNATAGASSCFFLS